MYINCLCITAVCSTSRRLDSNMKILRGSLTQAQLQLTRLHWVQEDVFIQAGVQSSPVMGATRATVMSEIKKVGIPSSRDHGATW